MIRDFAADPDFVGGLLRIVPRRFRSGQEVLAGLAAEADPRAAMIAFVRNVWDKVTQPAQDLRRTLQHTVALVEILDGIVLDPPVVDASHLRAMMRRVASWNQATTLEFLALRRAFADPDDGLAFTRWLLRESFSRASPRLRFEELRLNHPLFRGTPTQQQLEAFREAVLRVRNWNPQNELIRGQPFPTPERYGRRLEEVARQDLAALNRMVDNNALSVPVFPPNRAGDLDYTDLRGKSTTDGWRHSGQQFGTAPGAMNFPGGDILFTGPAGEIRVGQVSAGTGSHLLDKFETFLSLRSADPNSAHGKMVEHLQYMGVLSTPVPPRRGTDQAILDGARELLPRQTLFVPASEVEGLRALLASSPNFRLWMQDTGLSADALLQIVQPIAT